MATRQVSLAPSSNVLSAVYDEERRALTVIFRSGHTATYGNIGPETVKDFEMANSPGGFVHRHLRGREV